MKLHEVGDEKNHCADKHQLAGKPATFSESQTLHAVPTMSAAMRTKGAQMRQRLLTGIGCRVWFGFGFIGYPLEPQHNRSKLRKRQKPRLA
jgi:hypothetical protein